MYFFLNFFFLNSRLRTQTFFTTTDVNFRSTCRVRELAEFEFRIKIKYEGLDVVGAFFKIPENLVAAGLIMQYLDYAFA